jgi:anti-anti-sigma factor
MNVSPVLHLEENGVHTIAFHHDQQGQANTDLVLAYFAGPFLTSTAGVRRLVIDLSGVLSLNSASLGPLVQKMREIQDLEGQLALCGVTSPALKEIFALTRFDKVFPIYASRNEAISAVRGAGTGRFTT